MFQSVTLTYTYKQLLLTIGIPVVYSLSTDSIQIQMGWTCLWDFLLLFDSMSFVDLLYTVVHRPVQFWRDTAVALVLLPNTVQSSRAGYGLCHGKYYQTTCHPKASPVLRTFNASQAERIPFYVVLVYFYMVLLRTRNIILNVFTNL